MSSSRVELLRQAPPVEVPHAPGPVEPGERPERRAGRMMVLVRIRWLRYAVAGASAALVVAFLVVPQFSSRGPRSPAPQADPGGLDHRRSTARGGLLRGLRAVHRGVLPAPEGRPRFHQLLRFDVVGAGLTHVLPGGGATASGVRIRLLRNAGVDSTDAAFGSIVQGVGSAIVVSVLLLVGVLVVLPARGGNLLYLAGGAVGLGLAVIVAGSWLALARAEDGIVRLVRRGATRLGRADVMERVVRKVAARLHELAADPRLLVEAILWSAANWLFDAASLWVFVVAFGYRVDVGGILVAFGLANTLAILPVTPGGVGIIEGILVPALVGFGTPKSIALLGVLSWRVFNFWVPIPAGAVAWLSLGFRRGAPSPPVVARS